MGSWLIAKEARKHLYAVYGFCRFVDDLGDAAEGDRLGLLHEWETDLHRCYDSHPEHIIMVALQNTIKTFAIPPEPFLKLIEANRMDQLNPIHPTYHDLLYYCDHSANPVGHLFLYLFGYHDQERQKLSDATCTALQLTNFWQDIGVDLQMGRIYIPLEDMERFGYSKEDLDAGGVNERFISLMRFEIQRTRELFKNGLKLVDLVDKRIKTDIKLFSLGGMKILEGIERVGYDVFRRRPAVSKTEKALLLIKTLRGKIW